MMSKTVSTIKIDKDELGVSVGITTGDLAGAMSVRYHDHYDDEGEQEIGVIPHHLIHPYGDTAYLLDKIAKIKRAIQVILDEK